MFEPGRLIVANAGALISRVIRVKEGASDPFVIVDAAMNDLMRPALYDASARHPRDRARGKNAFRPMSSAPFARAETRSRPAVRWMRWRPAIWSVS